MVVQHNAPYMTANRHYNGHIAQMMRSSMRLSSGTKINSAADDPAGMAILQKMRAQIRGLEVAERLTNDLLDYYRTADSTLDTISKLLQRMNELAVQSANGTNSELDRKALDAEYKMLMEELDSAADSAEYNGIKIFGGSFLAGFKAEALANYEQSGLNQVQAFQIGPNEGDVFAQELAYISASSLGIRNTSIATQEGAREALGMVTDAMRNVSVQRSIISANISRIESKLEKIAVFTDNLKEAEGRISDTDMAGEIVNFTKHKILADVGTAVMLHERLRQETVLVLMDFDYLNKSIVG